MFNFSKVSFVTCKSGEEDQHTKLHVLRSEVELSWPLRRDHDEPKTWKRLKRLSVCIIDTLCSRFFAYLRQFIDYEQAASRVWLIAT